MLDSMVSPIHKDNKKYEKLNTPPAPKKQAILAFPELPALSVKNVSGEDTENAEPVKVTAFVKALPNTTATCFKKVLILFFYLNCHLDLSESCPIILGLFELVQNFSDLTLVLIFISNMLSFSMYHRVDHYFLKNY